MPVKYIKLPMEQFYALTRLHTHARMRGLKYTIKTLKEIIDSIETNPIIEEMVKEEESCTSES